MNNYNAIPLELRNLPNWICWRYEDIGARKPTKVPYNIKTGNLANVNDPNTWTNFDLAASASHYDGIGFVFSENDPFCFLDLDDVEGDQAALARQLKIYHEFDSYSEISPSGRGLHIIVKGKVPQGRRRSFIEVYSSQRYATMTGNVYNAKPIVERQSILTQLWEQMGSGAPATILYKGDEAERYSDTQIIQQALNAVNGDKFRILNDGNWQELYQSQSEADFAFIDIIAYYTQNRNQIVRIFHNSPLGKRTKARRQDYLSWMINKSFDRMLPPIDFDGFKIAVDNKIAEQQLELKLRKPNASFTGTEQNKFETSLSEEQRILSQAQQSSQRNFSDMVSGFQENIEMSNMLGKSPGMFGVSSFGPESERIDNISFSTRSTQQREYAERNSKVRSPMQQLPSQIALPGTHEQINLPPKLPPGLMGELAQFIYSAAPRPVPEIALAGAIGLMAGMAGRAYNVSSTGLNQYVLLLAATGTGKESMASGIDKLMNAIRFQVPTSIGFLGPSEIASGQALIKYLHARSQSFVSIMGEFGLRLQQMSSLNASSSEVTLRRMLLDLFNKSGYGQTVRPSIYSDKDKNTEAINSPAFSILGESTPERFYNALNEEMISEGLLPRFMLIEYTGIRVAYNKEHETVQPSFTLIEKLATLAAQAETINHANPRRVINITASEDAQKILNEFDKYSDHQINATNKDVIRQLWNRAHIKVLKLSGLVAVGCNLADPIIQADHVMWAIEMVQNDIRKLSEKFEAGEIGLSSSETKQNAELIKIIKEYTSRPWEQISKYVDNKGLYDARIIPYGYISRRLIAASCFKNDRMGASASIKRTIQTMMDSDKLREVGKTELAVKYGTTQRSFVISNLKILE